MPAIAGIVIPNSERHSDRVTIGILLISFTKSAMVVLALEDDEEDGSGRSLAPATRKTVHVLQRLDVFCLASP